MAIKLSKRDEEKFRLAQDLSRQGDLHGTLLMMKELVESNPDIGILRAGLANDYWDIGDIESAEREFKNAIALIPNSERASLGFFHCLWEQGKQDAALEELNRFMSLMDSDEYAEILKAIQQKYSIN